MIFKVTLKIHENLDFCATDTNMSIWVILKIAQMSYIF